MDGFARPYLEDETVDEIVIVSLSKSVGCLIRLM
jgi:hypothetical protein